MRMKKIAIGFTAVTFGRCYARAAQNHLVDHKFAVIFTECARPVF